MGGVDLQLPLRTLVPSLDAATLAVLAATESALGTSRIHRLSGRGSRAGHQKVLDRLVKHGLVLAEPANTGFTYRLNRDHVLTPTLLGALTVRPALLDRLSHAVAALRPEPEHAAVFGSFARGEATEDSDIDLFLLMPDGYERGEESWEEALQNLENQVLAWTGNRLEVLVLDRAQLKVVIAADEPILRSLRNDAVTVHGADIAKVLASATAP
jgi:predicted nucleotidyltransferase